MIVDIVHTEMATTDAEVIEIESDDEDELTVPSITHINALLLCEQLEQAVKECGDTDSGDPHFNPSSSSLLC